MKDGTSLSPFAAFETSGLTLKAPIMTAADDIHKYFSYFIICLAEDSPEKSSLIIPPL